MQVLVAYATKYGATRGIAEAVATVLGTRGVEARARDVRTVDDPEQYDAFVIGSAVFAGRWRPEARAFVDRHSALLQRRPVWLFSSGPLGSSPVDKHGKDLRLTSDPLDLPRLLERSGARGSQVFFGALTVAKLDRAGRLVRCIPAARAVMDEGDFRDWDHIATWAHGVADELRAEAT